MFLQQRLERVVFYELLKVIRQYEMAKPDQSMIRALLVLLRWDRTGRESILQLLRFRRTFCHWNNTPAQALFLFFDFAGPIGIIVALMPIVLPLERLQIVQVVRSPF